MIKGVRGADGRFRCETNDNLVVGSFLNYVVSRSVKDRKGTERENGDGL